MLNLKNILSSPKKAKTPLLDQYLGKTKIKKDISKNNEWTWGHAKEVMPLKKHTNLFGFFMSGSNKMVKDIYSHNKSKNMKPIKDFDFFPGQSKKNLSSYILGGSMAPRKDTKSYNGVLSRIMDKQLSAKNSPWAYNRLKSTNNENYREGFYPGIHDTKYATGSKRQWLNSTQWRGAQRESIRNEVSKPVKALPNLMYSTFGNDYFDGNQKMRPVKDDSPSYMMFGNKKRTKQQPLINSFLGGYKSYNSSALISSIMGNPKPMKDTMSHDGLISWVKNKFQNKDVDETKTMEKELTPKKDAYVYMVPTQERKEPNKLGRPPKLKTYGEPKIIREQQTIGTKIQIAETNPQIVEKNPEMRFPTRSNSYNNGYNSGGIMGFMSMPTMQKESRPQHPPQKQITVETPYGNLEVIDTNFEEKQKILRDKGITFDKKPKNEKPQSNEPEFEPKYKGANNEQWKKRYTYEEPTFDNQPQTKSKTPKSGMWSNLWDYQKQKMMRGGYVKPGEGETYYENRFNKGKITAEEYASLNDKEKKAYMEKTTYTPEFDIFGRLKEKTGFAFVNKYERPKYEGLSLQNEGKRLYARAMALKVDKAKLTALNSELSSGAINEQTYNNALSRWIDEIEMAKTVVRQKQLATLRSIPVEQQELQMRMADAARKMEYSKLNIARAKYEQSQLAKTIAGQNNYQQKQSNGLMDYMFTKTDVGGTMQQQPTNGVMNYMLTAPAYKQTQYIPEPKMQQHFDSNANKFVWVRDTPSFTRKSYRTTKDQDLSYGQEAPVISKKQKSKTYPWSKPMKGWKRVYVGKGRTIGAGKKSPKRYTDKYGDKDYIKKTFKKPTKSTYYPYRKTYTGANIETEE